MQRNCNTHVATSARLATHPVAICNEVTTRHLQLCCELQHPICIFKCVFIKSCLEIRRNKYFRLIVYFRVVLLMCNFQQSCNIRVATLLHFARGRVANPNEIATWLLHYRCNLQRVATKLQTHFWDRLDRRSCRGESLYAPQHRYGGDPTPLRTLGS